jgi:hypothetical protein
MCILDEGLFMNPNIILTVVLPIFQQEGSCVVVLSTPAGEDAPCTKLFNTKNPKTGKTIFLIVRIGKGCDACRAKKILCMHVESATGEGLSRKKREILQSFYAGDEERAMQEFQGDTAASGFHVFPASSLLELVAKDAAPIMPPIDLILVSIDPAGGGKCEWGLCACYYDTVSKIQVVVQLDANRIDDPSPAYIRQWIYASLSHIRIIDPSFASVPIIIACESAPATISDQIAEHINTLMAEGLLQNIHMMRQIPNNRPGVPKTPQNTQDMARYSSLLIGNGQVFLSEKYCTSVLGKTREMARLEWITQLNNFKKRKIPNKAGGFHIELNGKGGGKNDDLGVAYVMNFYWYLEFMNSTNTDYLAIKRQSSNWRDGHVKIDPTKFLARSSATKKRGLVDIPVLPAPSSSSSLSGPILSVDHADRDMGQQKRVCCASLLI